MVFVEDDQNSNITTVSMQLDTKLIHGSDQGFVMWFPLYMKGALVNLHMAP